MDYSEKTRIALQRKDRAIADIKQAVLNLERVLEEIKEVYIDA